LPKYYTANIMTRDDWREELHAVIAAREEHADLADEVTEAFLDRVDRAVTPLTPLRHTVPTYFQSLVTLVAGFLAAVFFLSVFLHTAVVAPLALVGLLVVLLAIPAVLRRALTVLFDRRYLHEEQQWMGTQVRPSIVARTYGSDRGLQQDASRLAGLGYSVSGQSRIFGGTKVTYTRRTS